MEISYWRSRWKNNNTGWHMDRVFPPLREYWHRLGLSRGATVLVPLCGKSLDMDWLLSRGHRVIGVEVSEDALRAVRERLGRSFEASSKGAFTRYRAPNIDLWCGDILKLRRRWLPSLDAMYDKAALIALPPDMRPGYAAHMRALLEPHSQILLNTFEYNPTEMNGPPFAVFEDELERLFGDRFAISLLQSRDLFAQLPNFHRRGLRSYLHEKIFRLSPGKQPPRSP